ncbi:MAG: GNAT family N-acetyltransferase [Bacteroidota bacterium]
MMDDIIIRRSFINDIPAIEELYKHVAAVEGTLARKAFEISHDYIEYFVSKSITYGIELVAVTNNPVQIVGEIHCYGNGLTTFAHVLGDLTIAVHPAYQGKGIGKTLFNELLNDVKANRPDILRIELLARESNERALRFYESLGFKQEGRLVERIRSVNGGFEDDIFMAWHRR